MIRRKFPTFLTAAAALLALTWGSDQKSEVKMAIHISVTFLMMVPIQPDCVTA